MLIEFVFNLFFNFMIVFISRFFMMVFLLLSVVTSAIAADTDATAGVTSGGNASATGTSDTFTLTGPLCAIYKVFAGPIGKILAMMTLVAIGISFFMAKITWTVALTVVCGVAAIFGAPSLVKIMTGGSNPCAGSYEVTGI